MFNTRNDFYDLVEWLGKYGRIRFDFDSIKLVPDPEQDELNARDPRAFCYVREGDTKIYCTSRIERLPATARVGVLLHETGHLFLNALGDDRDEVRVDEWILEKVPDAKYRYEDVTYISDLGVRQARNLQTVSESFIDRIRS